MRRAYGSGSVYKRPGSSTWTIQWRERERTRYTGAIPSRSEATRALRAITARVRAGEVGLPYDKASPTVRSEMVRWLAAREAAGVVDVANERSRWSCHLEAHFGDLRITEVSEAHLYGFIMSAEVRAAIGPATIGRCVALLSSFLTDLCTFKMIEANPVANLPRKVRQLMASTHDPRTVRIVETPEQADAVWSAMDEMYQVAYATASRTGLRPGEVLALGWEHVRLAKKTLLRKDGTTLEAVVGLITVVQQVKHGELAAPKDRESRVVPVGPTLGAILAAWRERTGGVGPLFFPRRSRGCVYRTPGASTWIVQWVDGTSTRRHVYGLESEAAAATKLAELTDHLPPLRRAGATYLSRKALRAALEEALKKVGLPPTTWYAATRHTFASHWMRSGGPIDRLRDILGHSSVTVTERYAHATFTDDDFLRLESK